MNTNDFSQDILAKIEEQHIEPRPRWQFFLMRSLWWGMAFVTTLIGGIAFASVLFFVREQEWGWVARESGMVGVMRAIPLLWLLLFAVFVIVTLYDVRATRRGYRYETSLLVGGIVLASSALGGVVYASGLEAYSHDFLQARVSAYRAIAPDPALLWQAPQQGRFIGVVSATSSEGFVLHDQSGHSRAMLVTSSSRWLVPQSPVPGLSVKVVSKGTSSTEAFELVEARPLRRHLPRLLPPNTPPLRVAPSRIRLEHMREKQEELREFSDELEEQREDVKERERERRSRE